MRLPALMIAALLVAPAFAQTDSAVPADHSTVHIVFVVPYERPLGAGLEGSIPQAVVGGALLPLDSIHPISITINGEFAGHAMPGFSDIKPVFVLTSGKHKFEFECEGLKSAKAELRVIGTGSKQYLIVKLSREAADDAAATPPK